MLSYCTRRRLSEADYICNIVKVSGAEVKIETMSLRHWNGADLTVTGSCTNKPLAGFTIKPQNACMIRFQVSESAWTNFGVYCRVDHEGEFQRRAALCPYDDRSFLWVLIPFATSIKPESQNQGCPPNIERNRNRYRYRILTLRIYRCKQ